MSPGTVLVIDDNAQFSGMLARALTQGGYAPSTARTTGEALARLEAGGIDAVLLDIVLGDENGWETLRRLRELSAVPVLLMTGADVNEETVRDARALGAQGVLAKPFELPELFEGLERVLRAHG